MPSILSVATGLSLLLFAAFPSSTTYQLNSYGLGPGGTNSASSTTYKLQGNAGEQANGSAASTTYTSNNGAIGTEQLNVTGTPTLSNGSNTYYNKLLFTIATSSDPSDATYSIAVSTNNFVTTSYVQADGTLGSSAVYQTYTQWGGASGSYIVGLSPSTTYKVKVDAMQGLYSNTAYSAAASANTVSPTLTFSLSSNAVNIGSLLPGSVASLSSLSVGFTTNANSGGGVYVSGQHNGLQSVLQGHTISAYTGDLSSVSEGFGVQVSGPTQASGGPFTAVSPFNGSGTVVGAESATFQRMLSAVAPITTGSATAVLEAKAASVTPASSDYQEVLTFVATANF